MKLINTASLVALAAAIAATSQAAPAPKFDLGDLLGSFTSRIHNGIQHLETVFVTLGPGETAPTSAAAGAMGADNSAEYGGLNTDLAATGDSESSDISSSSAPDAETSSSSSSGSGASDWVTQMVCRVNVVRAQNGAQPLGISPDLIKLAQGQSDYQNSISEMTHSNPSGGIGDRLTALGVAWASAAENVAAGMQTPGEAQDAWEKSPGHFANMIDASMSYFGAASNNNYYTQEYYGPQGAARAEDIPQCS
ncbi:hypothetical protein GGI23_005072 [Coemansia sp. RSA 2559]|nr:hypothetical protein GGI23_005072 [Coemansia sp. RSA 2559]